MRKVKVRNYPPKANLNNRKCKKKIAPDVCFRQIFTDVAAKTNQKKGIFPLPIKNLKICI